MQISIKKNEKGTAYDTQILDDSGKPLAYVKELTIHISADKPFPEVHLIMAPPKLGLNIEDVEAETTTEEPAISTQKPMQGEYMQGPHDLLDAGKLAAGCYTCEREDECRPMEIDARIVCDSCGSDLVIDALTGDEHDVTGMETECCLTPSTDELCLRCTGKIGEEKPEDETH